MASLYEDLADETGGADDQQPQQPEQTLEKKPASSPQQQQPKQGKEEEPESHSAAAEPQPEETAPAEGDGSGTLQSDAAGSGDFHSKPSTEGEPKHHAPEGTEGEVQSEIPLVFVGGLSWETTEPGLRMYFEQFGEIKQIDFKRGFAFVHFTSRDGAEATIHSGTYHQIDGRRVEVKVSEPHLANRSRQQRGFGGPAGPYGMNAPMMMSSDTAVNVPLSSPEDQHNNEQFNQAHLDELQNSRDAPGMNVGRKVFVGGLSQEIREPELRQLMEHHGTIEDVVVMIDKFTKRSRGFGFVTFSSREEAETASKNRRQMLGGKMCEVKLYEPGAKGQFYHQRAPYPTDASTGAGAQTGGGYQHQQQQDWTSHRPFSGRGGAAGGRGGRGYPQQQYGGGYYNQGAAGYYGDYSQQSWGQQSYGGYPQQGGWYGQQPYGGYSQAPSAGAGRGYAAGYGGQAGGDAYSGASSGQNQGPRSQDGGDHSRPYRS